MKMGFLRVVACALVASLTVAQAETNKDKLREAEELLAAKKLVEALAITSEMVRIAPTDPSAADIHTRIAFALKNYPAVEHYAPAAIEAAIKAKREDLAVRLVTTFSASFVAAMATDRGATLRHKNESWKVARNVVDTYPHNVSAAIAYVKLLRGFRGWEGERWSEIRRVAPIAIQMAYEQQRWAETVELADEYGHAVNFLDAKDPRRPSETEIPTIRADSLKLFDMAIDAGKKLRMKGQHQDKLGSVVGYKIMFQAQELGGNDYAGAIKTFREHEAYCKEAWLQRHGGSVQADEAAFVRYARNDLYEAADWLGELLLDTDYREIALWALDTYGLRKRAALELAARQLQMGDNAWKKQAMETYRRYGVTPPDAGSAGQVLKTARADMEHYGSFLAGIEAKIDEAATDRAKLMTIRENERNVADRYITAAMRCEKMIDAVETAERLQACALRDLLAQRSAGTAAVAISDDAPTTPGGTLSSATSSAQRDLTVQGVIGSKVGAPALIHEQEYLSKHRGAPMRVAEIQQMLDDDTTVVFLHASSVVSIPPAWGFVSAISKTAFHTVPQKDLLSNWANLSRTCQSFCNLVRIRAQRPWAEEEQERFGLIARRLYNNTLLPVREHLRTRRLVIVPSRNLYEVPVGLFIDEDGHFLAEKYAISYAPSATVLKFCIEQPFQIGDSVFVAANPALPDPSHALKFSEREAIAIQTAYPAAELCVGAAATEKAVREALPAYDIIHLACHGISNPKEPLNSFLALAADPEHDGRFATFEVLNQRTSAQLVVLSACDTGRGTINIGAQELMGMVRSWFIAGTPSVMVSLWKLDDKATSELMGEFYKNLKTMGRAEALQQAQLTMMKKYDNPYYWGAFVLYGDYR